MLSSACLHVLLASPFFNVRLPYEATLSVVAYACIVFLVIWVPVVGIIANIYGLCLMYLGFKAVHRLPALRAGVAVFLMVMQVEFIRLMILLLSAPGWMDTVRQALQRSTLSS